MKKPLSHDICLINQIPLQRFYIYSHFTSKNPKKIKFLLYMVIKKFLEQFSLEIFWWLNLFYKVHKLCGQNILYNCFFLLKIPFDKFWHHLQAFYKNQSFEINLKNNKIEKECSHENPVSKKLRSLKHLKMHCHPEWVCVKNFSKIKMWDFN